MRFGFLLVLLDLGIQVKSLQHHMILNEITISDKVKDWENILKQKVWNSLEINNMIQSPNSGFGFEHGIIFNNGSEGKSFKL